MQPCPWHNVYTYPQVARAVKQAMIFSRALAGLLKNNVFRVFFKEITDKPSKMGLVLTISISHFHAIIHNLHETYIFSELSVEGFHHFLLKKSIFH